MQLITDLPLEGNVTALRKKLIKRCKRRLRLRTYFLIENEVKKIFGPDYAKLKKAVSFNFITRNQERLNSKAFKSEKVFLEHLVQNGINNFYLNYPLMNRYFGDVVFLKEKLVVEVDGSYHNSPEMLIKDQQKDSDLTRFGYRVIRVDPLDLDNLSYAIEAIKDIVEKPFLYIPEVEPSQGTVDKRQLKKLRKAKRKEMKNQKNALLLDHDRRRNEFAKQLAARKLSGLSPTS